MKNPFARKQYGQSIAITRADIVEAREPRTIINQARFRLARNAHDTDRALAKARGWWRIWRPRGLDMKTLRIIEQPFGGSFGALDDVMYVGWTAWSR